MIYSNDRLRIVPFEALNHATDKYRSWFNNSEVTKYNSHGLFPYSQTKMKKFLRAIEESTDVIIWAVEILVETKWIHIGNCSLQNINTHNRSAELAVVMGECRANGYGMRVCKWMLEHAFLKLGLNRVWTGTAETNTGMNKICIRLGMVQEGVFEDGMWLNGEFVDVNAYGITRLTWDALR